MTVAVQAMGQGEPLESKLHLWQGKLFRDFIGTVTSWLLGF